MNRFASLVWALGVAISPCVIADSSLEDASSTVTVLAAGDVAECGHAGPVGSPAESTAMLIDGIPGAVLALGDLVYPHGKAEEFAQCYEPTWGRFKSRTYPVPGNHEYNTFGAEPYYKYWGARAGTFGEGYYSFTKGAWHIIALNSNLVSGTPAAKQEAWLRADLASHGNECKLAYFHHPRFTSGWHGDNDKMASLWKILHAGGVDVVLGGHDHDYERIAPLDGSGQPDAKHGTRQFIVGTGGARLGPYLWPNANSEFKSNSAFGVLKLTLAPHHYEWAFLMVPDGKVGDSGQSVCHPQRSTGVQAPASKS